LKAARLTLRLSRRSSTSSGTNCLRSPRSLVGLSSVFSGSGPFTAHDVHTMKVQTPKSCQ
jgi:hypothetical protein